MVACQRKVVARVSEVIVDQYTQKRWWAMVKCGQQPSVCKLSSATLIDLKALKSSVLCDIHHVKLPVKRFICYKVIYMQALRRVVRYTYPRKFP